MEKITICGTAQNSKAGAIVLTEENEAYFVEGKSAWPDHQIGNKVTVEGIIHSHYHDPKDLVNEKEEYSQGLSGEWKTIVDAVVMFDVE